MYLTYDEYSDAPFNGTLDEDAYALLEYRARKYIDLATHERVKDDDPVREAVKHAVYALVTMYAASDAAEAAQAGGVQSLSNDGVSVTYGANGSNAMASAETAQAVILKRFLAYETDDNGTPLLYAGVDL